MHENLLIDSEVIFDFIKSGNIEKDYKVVYARKIVMPSDNEEDLEKYYKVITVSLRGDSKIYLKGATDDTYNKHYLSY